MDIHYNKNSKDPIVDALTKKSQLFALPNFLFLDKYAHNKDGYVIDCGAHIGTYSILPAKNNRKVLAIEASRENFILLSRTFQNHNNVILKNEILLDIIKPCGFEDKHSPSGMVDLSSSKKKSNFLDNVLEDLEGSVSSIKYDIEGSEPLALIGSQNTIKKWKPPLLIEVNGHCLSNHNFNVYMIFNVLDELGYSYFIKDADKIRLINKNKFFPFCVEDVLAIHKDHIKNISYLEPYNDKELLDILNRNYISSVSVCKKYFKKLHADFSAS